MAAIESSESDCFSSEKLPQEEALDDQEAGKNLDEGYSPPGRPFGKSAWDTTADEAVGHESLENRLAHEEPSPYYGRDGDGLDPGPVDPGLHLERVRDVAVWPAGHRGRSVGLRQVTGMGDDQPAAAA